MFFYFSVYYHIRASHNSVYYSICALLDIQTTFIKTFLDITETLTQVIKTYRNIFTQFSLKHISILRSHSHNIFRHSQKQIKSGVFQAPLGQDHILIIIYTKVFLMDDICDDAAINYTYLLYYISKWFSEILEIYEIGGENWYFL